MANETPTYQERRLPHKPDPGRTHYEGCWQEPGHHNCAVVEVRALRERLAELEAALEDLCSLSPDCGHYTVPPKHWVRARRALESDHGEQSE